MYKCSTGEIAKDYKEYLKTNHWKNKKRQLYDWHWYACCVCGKKRYLEVHHKTYDRIGNEKLTDLLIVCKQHHYEFHSKKLNEENYTNKKLKSKRVKRNKKTSKASQKHREKLREAELKKKEEYAKKFDELTKPPTN